jgi:hypothetical protein
MLAAATKAEEEAEDEAREARERATGAQGTRPQCEEGDIDLVMCDVDGEASGKVCVSGGSKHQGSGVLDLDALDSLCRAFSPGIGKGPVSGAKGGRGSKAQGRGPKKCG